MRSVRCIPTSRCTRIWDYMRNRWPRDAGLRLDHLLLSPSLAKRLESAGVDRAVRGKPGASDHAPAWVVLRDRQAPRRRPERHAQRPKKKPAAPRTKSSRCPRRRPLLVIDGDSFAHRAYHALPKTILHARRQGRRRDRRLRQFPDPLLSQRTAARRARRLGHARRSDLPAQGVPALPERAGVRRRNCWSSWRLLPEFVAACGFANARAPGYEADDFLAAAVKAEEKRRGTVLVASGDRDTFQLASDRTTILFPARAGEIERIGPAEVAARYGVDPKQVPDFIALRGDPSDKLPGAKGIGAVGAAGLIRKYGSLEALLAEGKLQTQADALRLYRTIATMDPRAPIPVIRDQKPTWKKAAELVRSWELRGLAERLEKMQR